MKKCIIITTINRPSEQIIDYINKYPEWDLIIVADSKTNNESYKDLNCIYLSLEKQYQIFPRLSSIIPLKSYARKNIGYAYAFINDYDIIYDTDDDNFSEICEKQNPYNDKEISSNFNFVNIYKAYTDKKVWPRGLPLRYIDTTPIISDTKYRCPVIQGLVDGDPDVDAIFRIINQNNSNIFNKFDSKNTATYALKPYVFCPFNTQNTYWTQKELFHLMYLPSTVSMRFTDILRGYIAEHQLWKQSFNIKFTNSTAIQTRNKHDLSKDLLHEIEMFQYTENIIEYIIGHKELTVQEIYAWLLEQGVIKEIELNILQEWYNIFQ